MQGRFGEYGCYAAGNPDRLFIASSSMQLHEYWNRGYEVVVCASDSEASQKAREASNPSPSNGGGHIVAFTSESINNDNIRDNGNNNRAKLNHNQKSQNYLKGIARDARGRKIWGTWAPDRRAYKTKFKVFSVMLQAEREGIPPLDATWLALNAGVPLGTVLPAVTRWVQSRHINIYIHYTTNERGMTVIDTGYSRTIRYSLGKRGKHMLKRIREKQPEWCQARDKELTEWNKYLGERLQKLGANVHAAHTILKEVALE